MPVAPSLDSVGFLARDVGGLVTAMRLVEPGFTTEPSSGPPTLPRPSPSPRVGWLRGLADDDFDRAVGRALAAVGWPVTEIVVPDVLGSFAAAEAANYTINVAEAYRLHGWVLDHAGSVGADVAAKLLDGRAVDAAGLSAAWAIAAGWRAELAATFETVELLALPTLTNPPPRLDEADTARWGALTRPANLGRRARARRPAAGWARIQPATDRAGARRGKPACCRSRRRTRDRDNRDMMANLPTKARSESSRRTTAVRPPPAASVRDGARAFVVAAAARRRRHRAQRMR